MKQTCAEFLRKIVRRKKVENETKLATPLNRCLTLPHLILLGLSNTIGAGIYVLTGTVIRDEAGPATCISYLLSGVSALFTGFCYSEFSTLIPKAGSSYTYTYMMLGELPGFIIGWTMLSDYIVGIAAVSKALSGTINLLADNAIRNWTVTYLVRFPSNSTVLDDGPDLVAFGFLFLLVILTALGANISLTVNGVLTGIQIAILLAVTAACFVFGHKRNWEADGGFMPFGVGGILSAAGILIFAMSGFETIANASEEAKDPRRSLPRAIFASLGSCVILYILATLGLSYLVPRLSIEYKSPFVAAFAHLKNPRMALAFKWVAAIGTIMATGATKIASMYVVPRMLYALATDGLIFRCIGIVERRTQVPLIALCLGGFISCVLGLFFNIQTLADFTSIGIVLCYLVIGIDLMVLRYLLPHNVQNQAIEEPDAALKEAGLTLRRRVAVLGVRFPVIRSRRLFSSLLVCHVVADLVFGAMLNLIFRHDSVWMWTLFAIFLFIALVTFAILCCYEPKTLKDCFETKWMPIAPMITILVNSVLMTGLPALTWARFAVWIVLGLIIYLSYGVRNSNAATSKQSKRAKEPVELIGVIDLSEVIITNHQSKPANSGDPASLFNSKSYILAEEEKHSEPTFQEFYGPFQDWSNPHIDDTSPSDAEATNTDTAPRGRRRKDSPEDKIPSATDHQEMTTTH